MAHRRLANPPVIRFSLHRNESHSPLIFLTRWIVFGCIYLFCSFCYSIDLTMKIANFSAVLALLLVSAAVGKHSIAAFVPTNKYQQQHRSLSKTTSSHSDPAAFVPSVLTTRSSYGVSLFNKKKSLTALFMAQEDFDESKYTEAAWSIVATLTKAGDYYEVQSLEAPLLMDIMLNPTKHGTSEDADASKRVVEKALSKAGANVKDLRAELEKFMGQQMRVSGTRGQMTMGFSLQKVLETARMTKDVLGVSVACILGLFHCCSVPIVCALTNWFLFCCCPFIGLFCFYGKFVVGFGQGR